MNQRTIQARSIALSLLLSLLLLISGLVRVVPASADTTREVVSSEILVGVSGEANSKQAARLEAAVGNVAGYHPKLRTYRLRLRAGMSLENAITRLKREADVVYAEPNHIVRITATPNDTWYATRQYGPQKTKANLAWDLYNPQAQVIVAIVDTGIQSTHPDLTNIILRDVTGSPIGYNSQTGTTNANDDHGHGTHCAGTAAGHINNSAGIAGIAGWNPTIAGSTTFVKLMPVKVLNSSGAGTDLNVANGVTWAADHGAKVISLSLGGEGFSSTMNTAVQYAWGLGCVVVAAAGNNQSSTLFYPAANDNVISVAATDSIDKLASFSNYGSWVKVAAPGQDIYSTLPTNSYGYASGTSMACPHVAGEAALLLAHNPALTNSQVSTLIQTYVDPYTPYMGRTIAPGAGRINVYNALLASGGTLIPPAPTGLTANAGDAQVTLNWTGNAAATSYNVKRGTASSGPYAAISTGVTTANYVDTTVTNGTTYYYVVTAVNSSGESGNSNEASALPAGPGTPLPIRVNAGGPGLATSFGTFVADTYYTGGFQKDYGSLPITGTPDPQLYRTAHYGTNFAYNLPQPVDGSYILKLHFAEPFYTAAGQRKFDVFVNGVKKLAAFDIFAAAGGINKANVQSIPVTVSGGQINITFTSVMSSVNAIVQGIELIPDNPAGPPSAPTGLTATPGNAQVTLNWTASSGATSYNVKRGTAAGGPYSTTVATGVTTTNHVDTTVTNGTTYYYVVTAVNSSGESGNSNEASATPQVPAPSAPTGLAATGGDAQVTLNWTGSAGADSYNVKRGIAAGGPYTNVATGVTTTNYVDTTVTNGTTYYYVVTAVNVGGESPNSNEASATPNAPGSGTTHRINAGGPSLSTTLGLFAADAFFTGGFQKNYGPVPITGTPDPQLYRTVRYGTNFSYNLPVTNGNYMLKLHFAETFYTAAGQRKFDVFVNGVKKLAAFDVFAAAGGINKANVQSIPITVSGGQITISLTTLVGGNAILQGIEVIPQ